MKGSFILGVVGGIFAILIAFFEVGLAIIGESFIRSFGTTITTEFSQLYILAGFCLLAGIFGIGGGASGKKFGGVFMILGGVLALIGASLLGLLPFFLLIVGGILAIREKNPPLIPEIKNKQDYNEDIAIRLGKLKDLLDSKVITKEEYDERRKAILSQI